MLETRASQFAKRSIKTSAKQQGIRLAVSMLDLTTLEGADTAGKVQHLCAKAVCPAPRFPEILDEVDRGTPAERVYLGVRLLHFAIPAGSAVVGRRITTLAVAPDALIVAVRRGPRMLVPRGDTALQGGDRITVATARGGDLRLEDIVTVR